MSWNFLRRKKVEYADSDIYVLLRSRFQPVTYGHLEAVEYFFNDVSPRIKRKNNDRTPVLVLAIVCDLLKGTALERKMKELEPSNDRFREYLARFRPELNPLKPYEVIEDVRALIGSLKAKWRPKVVITLMPEFMCTLNALHTPTQFQGDPVHIPEQLIPGLGKRRWLIPVFDKDDLKDMELATTFKEKVYVYTPESRRNRRYVFDVDGRHHGVGLYGYSTACLLSCNQRELERLMPESVSKRWRTRSLFDDAQARAVRLLEGHGKGVAETLDELYTSEAFKYPQKAPEGQAGPSHTTEPPDGPQSPQIPMTGNAEENVQNLVKITFG